MKTPFRLLLVAVLGFGLLIDSKVAAQDQPGEVKLVVYWESTKPEHSLLLHGMLLMFHNGAVNLFDYHQPVPPFVAGWIQNDLQPLPPHPNADTAVGSFANEYPEARISWFWQQQYPGTAQPGPPPNHLGATVTVDPSQHRFLSYLGVLRPSDDAIIGNEDPFQIEVFDENLRFRGPMYIDVYGNQVLDAGLCENRETGLQDLDGFTHEEECINGEGFVQIHPGLNGSLRNPEGQPKRILGAVVGSDPALMLRYDETGADFTRPGYKLGRLVISRWAANGPFTGSWYSPERSGEGFNIEIIEPAPGQPRHRMLVSWYTYAPDGSGDQIWLTGLGEFDSDGGVAADIPMHRTVGGRFASTDNPDLVERIPWGRVRLGFGGCDVGRVFYFPDDPDWPEGDYFIHRLSPSIEGFRWWCNPDDARLVLPESP